MNRKVILEALISGISMAEMEYLYKYISSEREKMIIEFTRNGGLPLLSLKERDLIHNNKRDTAICSYSKRLSLPREVAEFVCYKWDKERNFY